MTDAVFREKITHNPGTTKSRKRFPTLAASALVPSILGVGISWPRISWIQRKVRLRRWRFQS